MRWIENMAQRTEITDFRDPALDVYARLHEAQLLHLYEPAPGICIVESPNVIERALNSGMEPVSFLMAAEQEVLCRQNGCAEAADVECGMKEKGNAVDSSEEAGPDEESGKLSDILLTQRILKRCPDVPVYTAPAAVLQKLTGFSLTRGLLCAMRRKALPSVEAVCSGAARIAVLEHVVNPTNVGAIFRSAAALHMDAIVLTPDCSDPLYRRAARVSMGTVFQIPWTYFPKRTDWPGDGMALLRELGFKSVAMALRKNTMDIDDPRLREEERLAIYLGAEGEGLLNETIDACDYTVKIPMSHGVDSLNVAAASAVAFWELGRRSR